MNFQFARYEFTLTARTALGLPTFAGPTLRGGFGHAFRRLVCVARQPSCQQCVLLHHCAYAYLFETRDPAQPQEEVARPFVLEPPLEHQREYAPGEPFHFCLTLFGQATDYLPYFIVAFSLLGQKGLGRKRGKFDLSEVAVVHPLRGEREVVYEDVTCVLRNILLTVTWEEVQEAAAHLPGDRITLRLLTNTRLVYLSRELRQEIPFAALVSRLLRRIEALAARHGKEALTLDRQALINRAKEVETVHSDLRWQEWFRFSGRQKRRVPLGGLVGTVTYEGNLRPFQPFLLLGQYTHVGKGCVMGMGKYELVASEELGN
ncbi:MAG TPA: CRISPR system precrRNA processing endoribonuclease RAMP protein Cas6 [Armatimonadetes bacterium]|nr:CRISPR system precrRNA processing endoribonuclease RAMP protein Cas6 [Armatimonadota bacterium]